MPGADLESLFRARRTNAVLGWILVAIVVLVAVEEAITGDLLWSLFSFAVVALAVTPAVKFRDPEVMPPWEVLLLAVLPVVGRAVATVTLTSALWTYVAVAALALILSVELHTFTPVRMTIGFAMVVVVVATMATAGIWAVVRGAFDWWFGTGLLPTEEQLGWEFVWSTVAGIGAAIVFEFYFRRYADTEDRVPEEVKEAIQEELAGVTK